jgi:hypothetical protein
MYNENYETLIWSGCSHSYPTGFFHENYSVTTDLNIEPVKWVSPSYADEFPNVKTVKEAEHATIERAHPHQIGRGCGFRNIHNLSLPGTGIEAQLRKVSSFIIENENKIDFTKCVFVYQIPSLTRIDLLKNPQQDWGFKFYNSSMNEERLGQHFILHHYDFDYLVAKFLMYLYEYKGFLNSKGITFIPFENLSEAEVTYQIDNFYPYIKEEANVVNTLNLRSRWTTEYVKFPTREELIKKIGIWGWVQDVSPEPQEIPTFKSEGINEDGHLSLKGHDVFAQRFIPELKKKLNIW